MLEKDHVYMIQEERRTFMNVFCEIHNSYDSFSKSNKKISDYILTHAAQIHKYTAVELAQRCGTSSASIIRYVKHLGYQGLDDFKIELAKSLNDVENYKDVIDLIITKDDQTDVLCDKVQCLINVAFFDFFSILDHEVLAKAIDQMSSSRKIYLLGIGSSSAAAYDLYHKLSRIGCQAIYTSDYHMMVELLHYATEKDVVIAISYSGESKETLYGAKVAKDKAVPVIAITRNHDSYLRDLSDICLMVPNTEHVVRVGAITSLMTTLALCDLLYLGVMQKDFDENEVRVIETRKLVNELKIVKK